MSDKITFTRTYLDGDTRSHIHGLVYLDVHTDGHTHAICGWVRPEIAKLVKDAPAMLELLRAIFHEYDQTYDGEQDAAGRWSSAASIPVEAMERVRELVDKHK